MKIHTIQILAEFFFSYFCQKCFTVCHLDRPLRSFPFTFRCPRNNLSGYLSATVYRQKVQNEFQQNIQPTFIHTWARELEATVLTLSCNLIDHLSFLLRSPKTIQKWNLLYASSSWLFPLYSIIALYCPVRPCPSIMPSNNSTGS